MTVLSTQSPTKDSPPRSSLKRKLATLGAHGEGCGKRPRVVQSQRRPKKPVGEPWPVNDLRAFDAPTELEAEINFGPMLREVLKARGWRYSTNPCHGTYDKESGVNTFFVKEFEASLRGQTPEEAFGKKGSVEDGYHLQAITLPKHALWMLSWMPFRVPGTANGGVRYREDFARILVEHGANLPGKTGNYRMCKFPHTETLMYKNNLTEAFKDKPWYPLTYILPRDKTSFLKDIRSRGDNKNNLWIGKPKNDYGGTGIRVYKGTDPDLTNAVRDSDKQPRSLIQHYLADPLLIGGYKFHMRIHLLITSVSPVEAFVQENGQCLFSTKPYTLSGKTLGAAFDPPVHVTNMGLNSKPENKENYFRKKPIVGRGQQIRMRQLISHLAETRPDFSKHQLWDQILNIAADSASYIAHGVKRHSKVLPDRHFELFGMDLMLDKDLKVWMCEINTDPGLGYPDKEVLGSPNPDYQKELVACKETFHDLFDLLGLDAGAGQTKNSLRHWFKLDFEKETDRRSRTRSRSAEHPDASN